jgi:hypothetical protein
MPVFFFPSVLISYFLHYISYFFTAPTRKLFPSALRILQIKIHWTRTMKVSKTGHHYDDENSPISQSVPNFQASTSHTPNTSEPAIPTQFENEQKARSKQPGSGRPKGSKSTIRVAPEDRPCRLGQPPGTGRLQRERILRPEKSARSCLR